MPHSTHAAATSRNLRFIRILHSSDTGPAMGSVGLRGVVAPRVEGGGSSLTEGDSRGYVREGFVRSIP